MNLWQAIQQVKFKLAKATWPDSPSGVVFSTVRATQGPGDQAAEVLVPPFAVIRVLESESDKDAPALKSQRLEVVVVVQNAGDQMGEYALIGGQRASQGRSVGRGLLEVEEQLLLTINQLNQLNQLRIQEVSSSSAEPVEVADRGYVVTRSYVFDARLTTARVYPSPNGGKKLTASVGGGNVNLSWNLYERFDLHAASTSPALAARGGLVLRRAAGATPPASISGGTGVTLSSDHATSVVDAPGSGTWSYALFARYDEYADGTTSLRVSDPVTVSSVVVP